MGLVSFLLLQGGTYWHLKLIALRQRAALPAQAVRVYRMLRVVNVVTLTAGFASITFTLSTSEVTVRDALWGYGLLGFATLEYINYYVVQLAHDNLRDINYLLRHRRLRKASLADDIDGREQASHRLAVQARR
jgi:hypothetical protein